ncbi:MAG: hypothetical protein WCX28_09690 [Bacteriovoracaceae bacterium]|nr:hypothetical protein [Bacteroidota bacterium]
MKKTSSHIPFLVLLLLSIGIAGLITSCQKKAELPTVSDYETFQDPIKGLEVQYPKDWMRQTDPKRTKIYSSQVVSEKFYDLYSAGSTTVNSEQGGVEIEISSESFKDVNVGTLEAYKATTMQTYSVLNLSGEQPAMIGKENGFKFSYKIKVGKETMLQGEKIIVAHDSMFYTVSISGFNDYFEVYKPLLDKVVESVKLPKPKVSYKDPNAAALPSAEVSKFNNDFVEFEHPDNFDVSMPKEKKGGALHTLHLEGLRKDCTFDLDIFPMKTDKGEVKFEKFVDDNKGKFKPKATGSATVDGTNAITVTAAPPAKDIERVVYFLTKGEKIYQLVVTWYKPLTNDFKPAFEKVVASMKLK